MSLELLEETSQLDYSLFESVKSTINYGRSISQSVNSDQSSDAKDSFGGQRRLDFGSGGHNLGSQEKATSFSGLFLRLQPNTSGQDNNGPIGAIGRNRPTTEVSQSVQQLSATAMPSEFAAEFIGAPSRCFKSVSTGMYNLLYEDYLYIVLYTY